jgi:hypothetical protein
VRCRAIDEWDRDPRRKWAESGINDKRSVGQPYCKKHVGAWRCRDRSEQDDARGVTDRLKPKLLKYGGKQCRMFEAITAAVSVD